MVMLPTLLLPQPSVGLKTVPSVERYGFPLNPGGNNCINPAINWHRESTRYRIDELQLHAMAVMDWTVFVQLFDDFPASRIGIVQDRRCHR